MRMLNSIYDDVLLNCCPLVTWLRTRHQSNCILQIKLQPSHLPVTGTLDRFYPYIDKTLGHPSVCLLRDLYAVLVTCENKPVSSP